LAITKPLSRKKKSTARLPMSHHGCALLVVDHDRKRSDAPERIERQITLPLVHPATG
jgi:hypothetical protein